MAQKNENEASKSPSSTDGHSFLSSMSSLDDFSNYTHTQYLVFPVQDKSKKPTLIKFPEDLVEEDHFKVF